jgi:hypothetical protein
MVTLTSCILDHTIFVCQHKTIPLYMLHNEIASVCDILELEQASKGQSKGCHYMALLQPRNT